MTARSIREQLHPTLPKEYLPRDEKFLVGYRSVNEVWKDKSMVKNVTKEAEQQFFKMKSEELLKAQGSMIHSKSSKMFNRLKEFE